MKKFWVTGLLAFASCAGMQQAYQEQVCNTNGGYERGMNDARAHKPMDTYFAGSCEGPTRDAAQAGYRDGYNAGLAANQGEQPATQIIVNTGERDRRRFFCEVHAFTKTYAGWGSSEMEARAEATRHCTSEYNEMHCREAECRRQ
jgi:hypothetical protein